MELKFYLPHGQVHLKFYLPQHKIYLPRAGGQCLMSSPGWPQEVALLRLLSYTHDVSINTVVLVGPSNKQISQRLSAGGRVHLRFWQGLWCNKQDCGCWVKPTNIR